METIQRLQKSGFTVIEDTGNFHVKSNATGALVKVGATLDELGQYVKCMDYVKKRHKSDINKFKYTKPVHR